MKRLLRVLVLILVITGLGFAVFKTVSPSGSVLLKGSFDPSTIHVYINNKRITPKDIGIREFRINIKPGDYAVLISGPGIKIVKTTMPVKPLLGGEKIITITPGDAPEQIAKQNLGLVDGTTMYASTIYANEWIGAGVIKPGINHPVTYALHFNYESGAWKVLNPDGLVDTMASMYKGAPKELMQFLTDTAAD